MFEFVFAIHQIQQHTRRLFLLLLPQFSQFQRKTIHLRRHNRKAFKRKSKLILVLVHLFMYLIHNKSLFYQLYCIFGKKVFHFLVTHISYTRNHVSHRVNISIVTSTYTILILQIKQKHISKEKYFPFLVEHQNFISKHFLEKILNIFY